MLVKKIKTWTIYLSTSPKRRQTPNNLNEYMPTPFGVNSYFRS